MDIPEHSKAVAWLGQWWILTIILEFEGMWGAPLSLHLRESMGGSRVFWSCSLGPQVPLRVGRY
jgi:hypothetical protein